MSSINKIKIVDTDTTYDISVSANGTLNTSSYTSNDVDQNNATSYVSVNKINNSDTHATIFSKVTTMMRNLRYLYNLLGSVDISTIGNSVTDAISNLNLSVQGKANAEHSHGVGDLPATNDGDIPEESDANDYIPTFGLLNQIDADLSMRIDEVKSATEVPGFTTNRDCGAIPRGTFINLWGGYAELAKMLLREGPDPNEYDSVQIDEWNSSSDVDAFFVAHNHENGWDGLKLGNYITINDGTYNIDWVIAGFDCEQSRTASDDTTYDNGPGLCLIPRFILQTADGAPVASKWHNDLEDPTLVGYINSDVHALLNGEIYNNLHSLLGNHIVQRNVLLTNDMDTTENFHSISSEWTTAYLTLPSIGQITNLIGDSLTPFDEGEANYYLPLFWHQEYTFGDGAPDLAEYEDVHASIWTRNIFGLWETDGENKLSMFGIEEIGGKAELMHHDQMLCLRPLMYLR